MTQQVIGFTVYGYKYCIDCTFHQRKVLPVPMYDPIFEEDNELYRCNLCNHSIMKEEP